jgi:hypothetical protein
MRRVTRIAFLSGPRYRQEAFLWASCAFGALDRQAIGATQRPQIASNKR